LALGHPSASWYADHAVEWAPAVTGLWWALEGGLRVDGEDLLSGVFLLDSGTSYLALPVGIYQAFIRAVVGDDIRRCQLDPFVGAQRCPCDVARGKRSIAVRVGVREFPLRPEDLLLPAGGADCVLQVMPVMTGVHAILGDTFLRTVHAVFDAGAPGGPRIGLAARPPTPRSPDVVEPRPGLPPTGDRDWQAILWLPLLQAAAGLTCIFGAMFLCVAQSDAKRTSQDRFQFGNPGQTARLSASTGEEAAAPYVKL